MIVLLYLVLGVVAGVMAGLFGIGGGLVIVPVLVLTFESLGMPASILSHLAVGTSLTTIIVTGASSILGHHAKAAVRWKTFRKIVVGLCIGAILGVKAAGNISGETLKTLIGIFILLVAVQMAFNFKPQPHRRLPKSAGLGLAGVMIGCISAIFGIGGGTLTVPFFTWCQVKMQEAVATASACGLPIAIMGAVFYGIEGWDNPLLPEWSSGYIYWPAVLGIVATSMLSAKLGVKLAHSLPAHRLKQSFSLVLLVVGLRFIVS